jgi:hypothetical protein
MIPRPALLLIVCLLLIVGVVQADTMVFFQGDYTGTNPTAGNQTTLVRSNDGTYSALVTGLGTSVFFDSNLTYVDARAGSIINHWDIMQRTGVTWNTAALLANSTVTSATASHYLYTSFNGSGMFPVGTALTAYNPSDPVYHHKSDYETVTNEIISSYSLNIYPATYPASGTRIDFIISNLSIINKVGYTAYAIRSVNDTINIAPNWAFANRTYQRWYGGRSISKCPYLTVIYTPADITPPDSITNLMNTTATTCSSVNWTWTNPVQTDYYRLNVYRNGTFWSNLTNTTTYSLWEGLPASTLMTFNSTTEDLAGNRNLTHWANASVMLPACGFAPVANFIANNVTTCKDIPVVFNDTSTNSPTTWHYVMTPGGWDSHFQDFAHAFDTAGLYTVELTAGNAFGSDTESKVDYINVSDCTPIPTPTPTPTPAPSISCFFTNITGATLEPNSSSWTLTSGGITWGMTITNESQGNISFFNCGGATLKNGGGSGGGEAAGAAFGIIGGIIGGLIVIRRKKP